MTLFQLICYIFLGLMVFILFHNMTYLCFSKQIENIVKKFVLRGPKINSEYWEEFLIFLVTCIFTVWIIVFIIMIIKLLKFTTTIVIF